MFVSRVAAFLAVSISGFVLGADHVALSRSQEQAATPAASGGVQLLVQLDAQRYSAGENPSFRISLRNSGKENLLLNGGELLGNGAEIWSSITCEFHTSTGQRLAEMSPLSVHDTARIDLEPTSARRGVGATCHYRLRFGSLPVGRSDGGPRQPASGDVLDRSGMPIRPHESVRRPAGARVRVRSPDG